jgi:hypothetical protein
VSSVQVETQKEAVRVLIADQVNAGAVPTQPAWADTIETEDGWAFFNVNGYLGTVTGDGNVIEEKQFAEVE